jgi:predicted DCC family thiol-disulfide oxidoreductase YuxK
MNERPGRENENRGARPLVLYQDRCRFCRAAARLVTRLDPGKRIAILPFDDPEAARSVVFLTEEELQSSWHLIEPDGTRMTKGDAGVALLEHLDATRRLGRALRTLHLVWLVGAIDALVSRLRPRASGLVADEPGPRRLP